MPPVFISSQHLTRRASELSSETRVAIAILVVAVIIMIIAVALLFIVRPCSKESRQAISTSMTSSRQKSQDRGMEIQTGYSAANAVGTTTSQQATLEGGRSRTVEDIWARQFTAVTERVKTEIMYPQGGIGDTPSGPSRRHTPASSKERVTILQDTAVPSPSPQDISFLSKKRKPRLEAIITEFPLTTIRKTPHSGTPLETSSVGIIKPPSPAVSRSARSHRNGSIVSFQTNVPTRLGWEGMMRPSEVSLQTPNSSTGKGVSFLPSVSDEPVQPRLRSSSLSRETAVTARGSVAQPPNEPVPTIVSTQYEQDLGGQTVVEDNRPPWFEHEEEETRRPDRKRRVLSAISERSINRQASTSTSTHQPSRSSAPRHISIGGLSVVHPPPPYTPEDLNAVPPLPTNPLFQTSSPTFYVTNDTETGADLRHSSSFRRKSDRSPHFQEMHDQHPSPVYEPGPYRIESTRKAHHQSLQRPQVGRNRPRSSSVPNRSHVEVREPPLPVPLPARGDRLGPQSYFDQRPMHSDEDPRLPLDDS